ncbi:MAG: hypothetical protein MZV70_53640 [Desulfobacterales bacterium]|nr:hypothetical protein [Desulfobacterales bacterium]
MKRQDLHGRKDTSEPFMVMRPASAQSDTSMGVTASLTASLLHGTSTRNSLMRVSRAEPLWV